MCNFILKIKLKPFVRVIGETRSLQVNLQGHKQRSKSERVPWTSVASFVLLEHLATADEKEPRLPGIDHPRCFYCGARAKFKANCQCRLHSYCFECHKKGRSKVQCETPRNQEGIAVKLGMLPNFLYNLKNIFQICTTLTHIQPLSSKRKTL